MEKTRGTSMPSMLMIFKKTTAISSEQSSSTSSLQALRHEQKSTRAASPYLFHAQNRAVGIWGRRVGYIRGKFQREEEKAC